MREVRDALGQVLRLPRAPGRIVSLVPSETESVAALGAFDALVGRTDYCVSPAPRVRDVRSVGGTKRFDVEAVCALEPDLVLANQEENGRAAVLALIARGLRVHVSFPCTLAASAAYLEALAALLDLDPERLDVVHEARAVASSEAPDAWHDRAPRVAVSIWRDPWMSLDGRTFASDVLRAAGAENVFAERPRRYPLARDLAGADAAVGESVNEGADAARDTRYPRFALDELWRRAPDVVLLPDEPYAFGDADAEALRTEAPPELGLRVVRVSGQDLFWYGVRAAGAVSRVRAALAALAP